LFRRKWGGIFARDAFYNPNLSDRNGRFEIRDDADR